MLFPRYVISSLRVPLTQHIYMYMHMYLVIIATVTQLKYWMCSVFTDGWLPFCFSKLLSECPVSF